MIDKSIFQNNPCFDNKSLTTKAMKHFDNCSTKNCKEHKINLEKLQEEKKNIIRLEIQDNIKKLGMIKALKKAMKSPPKADVELEKNIVLKLEELLKCSKKYNCFDLFKENQTVILNEIDNCLNTLTDKLKNLPAGQSQIYKIIIEKMKKMKIKFLKSLEDNKDLPKSVKKTTKAKSAKKNKK